MERMKKMQIRTKSLTAVIGILAMIFSACICFNGCSDKGEEDDMFFASEYVSDGNTSAGVIINTIFKTDDVVVANVIATDPEFGADPTGQKDSTKAI